MLKRIGILFLSAILLVVSAQINVFAAKPQKNSYIAAPTNLTAASITSTSVDLKWSSVNGAAGYRVYKAVQGDSNYALITTVSSASYVDAKLSGGNVYWYYVVAYSRKTTSAESNHISITTPAAVQPTPTPTPTPTVTPAPTPAPTPTPIPAASKEVLGFATYYYSGDKSSYNSISANASSIDEIATQTYTTDGFGNITGMIPTDQISYANSNGITTLAMINNNFDGAAAKTLLESPVNRKNLITNIQSEIIKNNYKGVCVDLEGVYSYDRDYYTTFMNEIYTALNPQGYTVTAAVPAKTNDSLSNTWNAAYDYISIANNVDKLILMTYDEHYPGGTAGPVASIDWVTKVVDYAVTAVPKEKLILGVAAYGYDWSINGTKAYSINGMYNIAAANNAQLYWDSVSKTPYFNYVDSNGTSHSAWFENAESVAYKLDLVNSKGLAGIAIWRLGLENSDYWNSINTKLGK